MGSLGGLLLRRRERLKEPEAHSETSHRDHFEAPTCTHVDFKNHKLGAGEMAQ